MPFLIMWFYSTKIFIGNYFKPYCFNFYYTDSVLFLTSYSAARIYSTNSKDKFRNEKKSKENLHLKIVAKSYLHSMSVHFSTFVTHTSKYKNWHLHI